MKNKLFLRVVVNKAVNNLTTSTTKVVGFLGASTDVLSGSIA